MSLRSRLAELVFQAVLAPLVSTVTTKIGEAYGDLIAFHINPPLEDEESESASD